ncbi:uncharacterized protein C8Q71DRAFT_860198 [Rhodofomes roseus]|uniref:Uncharacterized protein n=1 Tax=Rhodofomes roseus TaxID=34475 RepID=A0ABQ8K8I7_9APHY|nr:uncharacterized protein C8Q71DRAFT_860198 [Rhodofomes roseus]KAH9833403.1 hypothetical protein C8Q71DRAFT_860198 [Rhodofomes roseus]
MLASLARICRVFSNVALDALWRQLDSPEPPLRLILRGLRRAPAETLNLAEAGFDGNVLVDAPFLSLRLSMTDQCLLQTFLVARRPIQRARFARHARRINLKSLCMLEEGAIHPSVYFHAVIVRERDPNTGLERPLLPSLEELYCEPSPGMGEAILFFVGASVARVTLSLSSSRSKPKQETTHEDDALLSVICSLARSLAAQLKPSYLGRLNRLTLTTSSGSDPLSLKASCQQKHVPFVKGTLIFRVLRSLGVYLSTTALAPCLRSRCTPPIHARGDRRQLGSPTAEEHNRLGPAMTTFALAAPPLVAITKDDLTLIGARWAHLTTLDLDLLGPVKPIDSFDHGEPLPTLDGIVQLVKDCPRPRKMGRRLRVLEDMLSIAMEDAVLR